MGPLVGAVGYQWLRGYLLTSPIFKDLHLAMAGVILLLIVLFVPAGAVGWVRNHVRRLQKVLE
jgi:branched-chain amino acid transport system permease protein